MEGVSGSWGRLCSRSRLVRGGSRSKFLGGLAGHDTGNTTVAVVQLDLEGVVAAVGQTRRPRWQLLWRMQSPSLQAGESAHVVVSMSGSWRVVVLVGSCARGRGLFGEARGRGFSGVLLATTTLATRRRLLFNWASQHLSRVSSPLSQQTRRPRRQLLLRMQSPSLQAVELAHVVVSRFAGAVCSSTPSVGTSLARQATKTGGEACLSRPLASAGAGAWCRCRRRGATRRARDRSMDGEGPLVEDVQASDRVRLSVNWRRRPWLELLGGVDATV
ncbi:hypothetical protein QBC39DRAFT_334021 [Podospora conica]|nr:hypothetical protein QBC39DRAFT_334021 [Schizothecium conicum]